MFNFRTPELNYMTLEEENFAKNFARFINEANVIEINELFQRANRDIGQNANAKIVFYDIGIKTHCAVVEEVDEWTGEQVDELTSCL